MVSLPTSAGTDVHDVFPLVISCDFLNMKNLLNASYKVESVMNAVLPHGETLMSVAAKCGCSDIVGFFLEHGANPFQVGYSEAYDDPMLISDGISVPLSPVIAAATRPDNAEVLTLLLERIGNVQVAKLMKIKSRSLLHDDDMSVFQQPGFGSQMPSFIDLLIRYGGPDMLEMAVQRLRKAVRQTTEGNQTFVRVLNYALFEAIEYGRSHQISSLLDQGADVTTCTKEGESALSYAALYGHIDIVRSVAEREPTLLRGICGHWPYVRDVPLLKAIEQNNLDMTRTLLDLGVDWRERSVSGGTAPAHAVASGRFEIVDFMMSTIVSCAFWNIIIHYALHFKQYEYAASIVRSPPATERCDLDPGILASAVLRSDLDAMKFLLDNGCSAEAWYGNGFKYEEVEEYMRLGSDRATKSRRDTKGVPIVMMPVREEHVHSIDRNGSALGMLSLVPNFASLAAQRSTDGFNLLGALIFEANVDGLKILQDEIGLNCNDSALGVLGDARGDQDFPCVHLFGLKLHGWNFRREETKAWCEKLESNGIRRVDGRGVWKAPGIRPRDLAQLRLQNLKSVDWLEVRLSATPALRGGIEISRQDFLNALEEVDRVLDQAGCKPTTSSTT
eukprot:TRINITY_DN47021_c0_g1_i1.p1 TRINITY_DN47021_c0_g1~~TRINITY_DN47021_c0_g1_i1.p1  ORF type:complete len:696 (-),score=81.14 TRINITY_DN47021_c0_g1_i1:140-1990(-)